MADHNKPVLTSTYANFVSELDARFDDLSLGLDPAVTSATNLPVNAIRWNSALAKDQKWNGSAWVDKSSFYALGSARFNNGTAGTPSITFSDDTTTGIFKSTAQSVSVSISGVERMRITSAGHFGVGNPPSPWASVGPGQNAIQSLSWAVSNDVNSHYQTNNAYYDTGGWTYISGNKYATLYQQDSASGSHKWYVASAGAAGTGISFSEVMSLSNSGKLSVNSQMVVSGASGNAHNQAALEVQGGGTSAPSILPSISFNNPGVYAGTLRQDSATEYGFYTQGGNTSAALKVSTLYASQSESTNGFKTTTYLANQRNPIWRFGNATDYGLSYFQGTSGYNNGDSIGIHFGDLNGGAATGQNSHIIFTPDSRVIAKRFQGLADQSTFLKVTDADAVGEPGDRGIAHITPQSSPQSIRADFATGTGTGSLHSGVLTFSPYEGTTTSIGGPSYQLAFGSTENNGGTPQLRIRNGIDTTWNAWVDVMTPAGAVMHFAMSTAPSGYLKANGAAVSRTAYKALFDAIGSTFGSGDGSTTFNLPDLRNEFIRGWADGSGADAARVFGSWQVGSVESHTHAPPAGLSNPWLSNPFSGDGHIDSSNVTGPAERNAIAGNTQAYGGTETRPRNVALLACIKF